MYYQLRDKNIYLSVKIKPNAKKAQILDIKEERLNIAIQAPPIDGAANKALIEFLAKTFDLPKSTIEIIKGINGRYKLIKIPYNQARVVWLDNLRK